MALLPLLPPGTEAWCLCGLQADSVSTPEEEVPVACPCQGDDQQREFTDVCLQNNQRDCILPQEAWDNTGGGAGRDREVPVQMPPDEGVGEGGNLELRNQIQLM